VQIKIKIKNKKINNLVFAIEKILLCLQMK
jgi:hypothetical protein